MTGTPTRDMRMARYMKHRCQQWLDEVEGRKQIDLSRASGISPTQVTNIMQLKNASPRLLSQIAVLLGEDYGMCFNEAKVWPDAEPPENSLTVEQHNLRISKEIERMLLAFGYKEKRVRTAVASALIEANEKLDQLQLFRSLRHELEMTRSGSRVVPSHIPGAPAEADAPTDSEPATG